MSDTPQEMSPGLERLFRKPEPGARAVLIHTTRQAPYDTVKIVTSSIEKAVALLEAVENAMGNPGALHINNNSSVTDENTIILSNRHIIYAEIAK